MKYFTVRMRETRESGKGEKEKTARKVVMRERRETSISSLFIVFMKFSIIPLIFPQPFVKFLIFCIFNVSYLFGNVELSF